MIATLFAISSFSTTLYFYFDTKQIEKENRIIGRELIEALNKDRVVNKLPEGGIYKLINGKVCYYHVSERGLETTYHLEAEQSN